ncbi:MAG: PorT family protein [Cyclobacteriaceae bacterium]|nr:PorT family protein [Cyclobacteriaceae bacterium]MCB0499302.1 PorT family protein [Cyclobacteriaceae bacterium]MCB9236380.1 PorT family protein [Flammeovirgaceae bacterium]MCO5272301.1 PorT family protein [Cyclobacteriaceae bacterium]MCW5902159.1 PorT family protein [Cyclobacteriaceae bacterium]
MKKTVFLVCLVAAFGCAQNADAQAQFALGIKGGLNIAKFDISQGASNIDNRTGYHGGAFALFKFAKFGIQPEILFSKQGSDYKVNTDSYEANFDYINIPVLLKLYLVAGLNIQAGPQFGFLTTSELKQTISGITTTQDVKDQLDKKSDTSIAVGAGWDLPFGLTLDARYNFGLSDFKLNNGPDLKNKVLQVSVGYKFIKAGK